MRASTQKNERLCYKKGECVSIAVGCDDHYTQTDLNAEARIRNIPKIKKKIRMLSQTPESL